MSSPQRANITLGGVTAPGEFVKAQVTDEGSPFHGTFIPVATEWGDGICAPLLREGDRVEATYYVEQLREFFKEPDILFFQKKL